ncbi:Yae1_N domain-containing protein, partial [Cephalotus follicularis]
STLVWLTNRRPELFSVLDSTDQPPKSTTHPQHLTSFNYQSVSPPGSFKFKCSTINCQSNNTSHLLHFKSTPTKAISPAFLMDGYFAKELYLESLQLSKLELDTKLSHPNNLQNVPCASDNGDFQKEDGLLWGGSEEELDNASDLDWEWQRRHDQFHTIGYRDGLMAGKEASAQEGFNIGFKQSVQHGYNLGLVRGVTSALDCLPHVLRERLIVTQERRNKFHALFETVHILSTGDALKLYRDDLKASKEMEHSEHAKSSYDIVDLKEQRLDCSSLENYFSELQSLLLESPAINVHTAVNRWDFTGAMTSLKPIGIFYFDIPIENMFCAIIVSIVT